jgi:hypothetical protein
MAELKASLQPVSHQQASNQQASNQQASNQQASNQQASNQQASNQQASNQQVITKLQTLRDAKKKMDELKNSNESSTRELTRQHQEEMGKLWASLPTHIRTRWTSFKTITTMSSASFI